MSPAASITAVSLTRLRWLLGARTLGVAGAQWWPILGGVLEFPCFVRVVNLMAGSVLVLVFLYWRAGPRREDSLVRMPILGSVMGGWPTCRGAVVAGGMSDVNPLGVPHDPRADLGGAVPRLVCLNI